MNKYHDNCGCNSYRVLIFITFDSDRSKDRSVSERMSNFQIPVVVAAYLCSTLVVTFRWSRQSIRVYLFAFQQIHIHIILAFDVHRTAWLKFKMWLEQWQAMAADLNATRYASRVHTTGNVDSVTWGKWMKVIELIRGIRVVLRCCIRCLATQYWSNSNLFMGIEKVCCLGWSWINQKL